MAILRSLIALSAISAALVSGLIPPCLEELGPEFCPSSRISERGTRGTHHTLGDYEAYRRDHPISYPDRLSMGDVLTNTVFPRLNKTQMEADLRTLTDPGSYPNRYCQSRAGRRFRNEFADMVQKRLHETQLDHTGLTVEFESVDNETPQQSLVLRLMPAAAHNASHNTIVLGAHMDSINSQGPRSWDAEMVAPGADDNGSGTVVIWQVLSALMPLLGAKNFTNEIQFHWYGAEETGLLGSAKVFEGWQDKPGRVLGMLNLDMVGFSGGHKPGHPEIAMLGDYIDDNLTAFTKKIIETYTNATVGTIKCGYPCSDHASAHINNIPSAMIGESSYLRGRPGGRPTSNMDVHSEHDTIDHIDFDYMVEFAKVAAAFVAELAFTEFAES